MPEARVEHHLARLGPQDVGLREQRVEALEVAIDLGLEQDVQAAPALASPAPRCSTCSSSSLSTSRRAPATSVSRMRPDERCGRRLGRNSRGSSACAPAPPTANTRCGGSLGAGSSPSWARSASYCLLEHVPPDRGARCAPPGCGAAPARRARRPASAAAESRSARSGSCPRRTRAAGARRGRSARGSGSCSTTERSAPTPGSRRSRSPGRRCGRSRGSRRAAPASRTWSAAAGRARPGSDHRAARGPCAPRARAP